MEKYDKKSVVGIGLGPSNLALAIAMLEETENKDSFEDWVFLEQSIDYAWHPGMLIEGAEMQVPFLLDLVTLRNPMSPFTFTNYLKCKGRLSEFINLADIFQSREEYCDYLKWVKDQLPKSLSRSGKKVTGIYPIYESDNLTVKEVKVEYEDVTNPSEKYYITTDNLVISVGGKAFIPNEFSPLMGNKVFHSSEFKSRVEKLDKTQPLQIGVIGSGQSAAEIVEYLHSNLPESTIYPIMRGPQYKPCDDSQLINQSYFPNYVDFFYKLEGKNRNYLLDVFKETNYSVVKPELIKEIYKRIYQDKIKGIERIKISDFSMVSDVSDINEKITLNLENLLLNTSKKLELDVVILATGYDRKTLPSFLDEIKSFFIHNKDEPKITRDYQIETVQEFQPKVYIQGMSESTHGISHTLLSVLPIRASEILQSIQKEVVLI